MGNKKEYRTVGIDTRKYCPVLKEGANMPGVDLQAGLDIEYEIFLDPDLQAQEGATCPVGDGYPMLQLEEAGNRETPRRHIRAIVMCEGCTHLPEGFQSKEIRLKPTVRT